MDTDTTRYVTNPTRSTLFMRTFLPYQLWRFLVLNTKMVGIIRRSHKTDVARHGR